MSYVIGIDPPQGWAMWSAHGVVAWGQAPDGLSAREKRAGILQDIETALDDLPQKPLIVAIEFPYGAAVDFRGNVNEGMIQSLVAQADSGGWFEGKLEDRTQAILRPTAPQWRKIVGVNAKNRAHAKDIAIRLAEKAVAETTDTILRGPRGGTKEHAAEAILIAMAAWITTGKWKNNPADAYYRYVKSNSFRGGRHGTEAREGRDPDRVDHDGDHAERQGQEGHGAGAAGAGPAGGDGDPASEDRG